MELFQYKDMQKQNDDSIYTQNIISVAHSDSALSPPQNLEDRARSETCPHLLPTHILQKDKGFCLAFCFISDSLFGKPILYRVYPLKLTLTHSPETHLA